MDTILVHSKRSVNHGRLTCPLSPTQFLSVTAACELPGTTFPGAKQIVCHLAAMNDLAEIAVHRRFRYDGSHKLFDEGAEL